MWSGSPDGRSSIPLTSRFLLLNEDVGTAGGVEMHDHSDGLLDRYVRIVRPNLSPISWCVQEVYGQPFRTRHRAGGRNEIRAMLLGRYWIACRAPADGQIDWISFDIDAKTPDQIPQAVLTYWRLRRVMGDHRVPLVYQTPSGGLRVLYRIPRTPIDALIQGLHTGPVADVLRRGGLEPRRGGIEIFPQRKQADRLMLGRRMPLLDPETLEVLPHASIGDVFDVEVFRQALEEVERWYQRPDHDLVRFIRASAQPICATETAEPIAPPSKERSVAANLHRGTASEFLADGETAAVHGLPGPSTRYHTEFHVGLAMALAPHLYEAYGLPPSYADADLAWALARWLSRHHNGYSREWARSVAETGSVDGAIRYWCGRYLAPNSSGESMIDRILRVAWSIDPLLQPVRIVAPRHVDRILEVAERKYPPGAQRYRFEVWTSGLVRATKEVLTWQVDRRVRSGRRTARPGSMPDISDRSWVEVEIAADWMERWPYGSGRNPEGRTRYLEYRDCLIAEGMLEIIGEARMQAGPRFRRPRAMRYRLPTPETALARDLPATPWDMEPAIEGIEAGYGRPLELTEAYHILHLTRRGVDVRRRYGVRTAERISAIAATIEQRLQARDAHRRSDADLVA